MCGIWSIIDKSNQSSEHKEKIQDVTVLQIFGIIGALTICGFFLVLLYSLFRVGTRKGYNRV